MQKPLFQKLETKPLTPPSLRSHLRLHLLLCPCPTCPMKIYLSMHGKSNKNDHVVNMTSTGSHRTKLNLLLTETVKVHTAVLLPASVNAYVTAVVPTKNSSPGVCDLVCLIIEVGVSLSLTVGSNHVTETLVWFS